LYATLGEGNGYRATDLASVARRGPATSGVGATRRNPMGSVSFCDYGRFRWVARRLRFLTRLRQEA